jgi:hypothetical protein
MKFDLNIRLNEMTANHLLGGLAQSYRDIPASAPKEVANDIQFLMVEILEQMDKQGIDIFKPRSPFASYAKLIRFEIFRRELKLNQNG